MTTALPLSLTHSAPPLSQDALARVEASLSQHCNLTPLPQSYGQFLLANNGGCVSPGVIDSDSDSGEHTHAVVFDTPLLWARDNDRPVSPELVFFFFAYDATTMVREKVDIDASLYELVASNRYSREDFDLLPPGMMSIAKVQHSEAADMLCISLSEADYGAVYYHYGMWDHPARFHGDFYDRRQDELLAPFGDVGDAVDAVQDDEDHPLHAAVNEALMRVPFVRVADSFEEWLLRLRVLRTSVA